MTDEQHQLIRWLEGEMYRLTNRSYRIVWEKLEPVELREMQRFLRDIDTEMHQRARRAQMNPWRRP